MIKNVRVLESKIESGAVEGRQLENIKATLEKVKHMQYRPDAWDLENNEGTYGTELVITKDGHIHICLCIMKKYDSKITYVRVGQFQQQFSVGDVYYANGKEREYQKLGNILNAIQKEYEKYGFYFDVKNNREILKQARKAYEIDNMKTPEVEEVVEVTPEPEEKAGLHIVNEDYDNTWTCVLEKSIKKVANKKEHGLVGTLKIVDLELGRIYFDNSQGEDCTLRMWNYYEINNGKTLKVEWTMFREIAGDSGGTEIGRGITLVHLDEVPELSPEKEEKMNNRAKVAKVASSFLNMEEDNVKKLLVDINEYPEYVDNSRFVAGFHLHTYGLVYEKQIGLNGETVEQAWETIKEETKTYVMEWVREIGIEITIEKHTEKMEEVKMKALNKNGLSNRMEKLGKFLKNEKNRNEEMIRHEIHALFPNAMEVQIFEDDDDTVYFLAGQDYAGKTPTKKEMSEKDSGFKEVDRMYGLAVDATIYKDVIKVQADIEVEYSDVYYNTQNTNYEIKEIQIPLELTMEVAQEKVTEIKKKHEEKRISATQAWERLKRLAERETTDEVLDMLVPELEHFAKEEKKEELLRNTNDIEVRICEIDALMQDGTMRKDIALDRLSVLFDKAVTPELEDIVDLAIRYVAVRKDENLILPEKIQEILDRRYAGLLEKRIAKLESIKDFNDEKEVRKALRFLRGFEKTEFEGEEEESKYHFKAKAMNVYRGKIDVDIIDAPNGVNRVLRGREVVITVECEKNKKATISITTRVEYLDNDGVLRTDVVYLYKKEIDLTPEPEKDELDKLIAEYNEVASEIDALHLNESVGEDCSKALANKHEKLMKLQHKINETGDVIVVKYSHRCFMNVPDAITIFRTQKEVEHFERTTENILEITEVFSVEKKEKLELSSNPEDVKEKIKQLEEKVNGKIELEDARKIMDEIAGENYIEWENDYGYGVKSKKDECLYNGIGDAEEIYECEKVIRTQNIQYGIEYTKGANQMIITACGDTTYKHYNGETLIDDDTCFYYKEVDCNSEPEDDIKKEIKEHLNAVMDLSTKENNGVGYMYKKTIAIEKDNGYELTSMFEDMWTGMAVYIGHSGNMIMIPNSKKCSLTLFVDNFLCSNDSINETADKIIEKIKKKFEYTYSKSITVTEDEKNVFVVSSPEDVEVFGKYEDAYDHMVKLVKEMEERFSFNYKAEIGKYSAKVDTINWNIREKYIK